MSSPSPELSCDQPMKNDEAGTSEPRRKRQRPESTKPSSVSMKSSRSLMHPPVFSGGTVTSDPSFDYGAPLRIIPGLRKYACDLTLDPNTAHTRLILSDDNRRATHVQEPQKYPDHPDQRFEQHEQVLCRESLSGRCYWEVEWSGWAYIAVTYKAINRKGGSESWFGYNDKSWSLYCTDDRYSAWHDNKKTDMQAPSSSRVGVYLDVSAGSLSYFSVSDTHTLTHLHTFNTTFTEPLYAGFRVFQSSLSLIT